MIQRKPRDRSKSAKSQNSPADPRSESRATLQLPQTYPSFADFSPSESSLSGYATPVMQPACSPQRPTFGRASTWCGSSGQLPYNQPAYSATPPAPTYSQEDALLWTTWAGDLHLPGAPPFLDSHLSPSPERAHRTAAAAGPHWSAWARTCGTSEPALAHVVAPPASEAVPNGLTMRGFDEYQPMLTPPLLVDDARRREYFDVAGGIYPTGSRSGPPSVQGRPADLEYAPHPPISTTSDPRSLQRPHRLRTVPLPSSPLCGLGLNFDGLSNGGGRSRMSPLHCR